VYHLIEFVADCCTDLERGSHHPLEQVGLHRGTRRRVQLRPHVIEDETGPVEVADLFFEDGSAARNVPFSVFTFMTAVEV
jgi:hypothetical protein